MSDDLYVKASPALNSFTSTQNNSFCFGMFNFFMFSGTEAVALVMSRDRPHLSFELNLLSSEQTYDYPQQTWRFQSQYALRDYTGVYFIKLIPCTADEVGTRESQV